MPLNGNNSILERMPLPARMQCGAVHTFSPRRCTPNKFSLPCRKHSLMCLHFHSNSRLLSSASTSHVYESVHLPGGLRTSPVAPPPSPTPAPRPASFNRHFLKCQLPTGPKDRQGETEAEEPNHDTKTNNVEPTGWLVTWMWPCLDVHACA